MRQTKHSILYIDDESDNLQVFKAIFWKEFEIFLAESVPEALEIMDHEKIELIIADQKMPNITGIEFLEYTKTNYPAVPRILTTGYTKFDIINEAIVTKKIHDVVYKPWIPEEFGNLMRHTIKLENQNN